MDQFPGNSHAEKKGPGTPKAPAEPKKQVEKVVQGSVARRKQPLSKRFKAFFIQTDGMTVKEFVTFSILLPAAKDALSEAISRGADFVLYGEEGAARSRRRRGGAGPAHTSYSGMSRRRDIPPWLQGSGDVVREELLSRRARATHNFDQIVFDTRADAEDVLIELQNSVNLYDAATVGDLYNAVGETAAFTDENYGWTDLTHTRIVREGGGFVIDFPPTEVLKRR